MKITAGGVTVENIIADIVSCDVDAVVNPANSDLVMGGGVAGAILKAGGRRIQDECDMLGKVPRGGAAVTCGGRLKASFVIHAVGPRGGTATGRRSFTDAQ